MQKKSVTRLILFSVVAMILMVIVIVIRRSIPYKDSPQLLSANISIDSILTVGPAVAIYDSSTETYYWLKSVNSLDMTAFDTLQSKKASIRYMKFLKGPLENRVYHMEVNSIVVIDQIVE
jgi:heme/copper-type cytochrome/quinol oxidase subunit 2